MYCTLCFFLSLYSDLFNLGTRAPKFGEIMARGTYFLIFKAVTCLTANLGVMSSIPARSHTFVEIDHEIISMVILLPSTESFKKGQLQAEVCAQSTG